MLTRYRAVPIARLMRHKLICSASISVFAPDVSTFAIKTNSSRRNRSPRSPWQNGYAERLIGSIRRECLDHVVVFGERHLRHLLLSYMDSYNTV